MVNHEKCPRCRNGELALEKDQYGWYEYCLQCGYELDLTEVDELAAVGGGG